MYSSWQIAFKYFRYYIRSDNGKGHGIHSPFVYRFVKDILNNKKKYPAYEEVEKLRNQLLNDHSTVSVDDMGAGSTLNSSSTRKVSAITRNSAKSKKYSQLIHRIVNYFQPGTIIELGTSVGITTSYMALGNPSAGLYTVEGAEEVAAIAKKNFKQLGLTNISMMQGNFDVILPTVLAQVPVVDFCFIDGNHQYEPTLAYFKLILPKVSNDSVLIFDDIHWSAGMEQAWRRIQADEKVFCTIDLFFLGIVFFREEFREKQHFSIRF